MGYLDIYIQAHRTLWMDQLENSCMTKFKVLQHTWFFAVSIKAGNLSSQPRAGFYEDRTVLFDVPTTKRSAVHTMMGCYLP